ncbi:G/T mismatch-specific thymine DNA glycosylase-like [Leptopilina heterotoma]|uniref:G/T mismatch-specific thymine DNA glycosylase-like n=1 Tax=Leptopilina heterotoma TaxID=63436 RepID=UPI001CA905DF|nr:G/T mismatch-specific thymine DNA glycosylase-like [Leptopilina heterotoma]XP_043476956.1 G/T mismatch-specific thymine DNA glycosylase-like [Leptopilina heterotoma]
MARPLSLSKLKKRTLPEINSKPKAKMNRFNGLTEEEVQKNSPPLPDYLKMDLDIVFVGINPSLTAAYRGRYYAGPGNHFYKLLHESGLVSNFINFEEDEQLLNYGIGLTNIVDRATRSSADLTRTEIKQGSIIIRKKLQQFKPKIAVFNGRCIYDVFASKTGKSDFYFGLQPERIDDTAIWVVPSSSARCSNFPRMIDKLKFYLSLKKYLSFLKGEIHDVNGKEFYFTEKNETSKMWRGKKSLFSNGGKVVNKVALNSENSDDDISSVSNEFVIKEIKSLNGIEKLPSIENNSLNGKKLIEINHDGGKLRDSSKALEMKNRDKINFQKLSPIIRKRENSSDFLSLIKQRVEAKKRKADEENF